ncbi:sigma-70 family RNA polymerase sigma factor [Bacillus tuaregi]|uniref:sigma-70 family RNA polymerase sigma factor n=1 Tax=Bacillus tuaregi TaxID=1816695 RepID=UPI0008F87C9D|nr:sigma-70 family RNA polymerase sigma factor [Bacillus tuaregi]
MHEKECKVLEDVLKNKHKFSEEELHEIYPKLLRNCRFLSQNSWDGEDLVQESLMKAWLRYKHQPEISMALLNKIARNEWIDTVRKRRKESLEAIPEHAFDESKQIENRFEAVQKLMNKLTPKQAIMFLLKEGFQFQLSEIAELLNTTEMAVKATIYRAKQRMEKQEQKETNPLLEQYWDMEEQVEIERLLHNSIQAQDPTVLIRSIPYLKSLRKDTSTLYFRYKSHHLNFHSSTVYTAA